MSKKILVLEPSATTQSLIKDKFKKTDFEAVFETNGIKFLVTMYNTLPSAILINARCVSPKCGEIVRLIKTVEKFKNIPVGVYSTGDYHFERHFMLDTGTDLFIHLVSDNLAERVSKMIELAASNNLSTPMTSDIVKSGIAENIFSFMKHLEHFDTLSEKFLNLLTEFCEVPAVSLYVNTEDGAEVFFMCSKNFTDEERSDFLKVCVTDFEKVFPDTNIIKAIPKMCESTNPIEKYHTGDIPLSAFQSTCVKSSEGVNMGTVNMVREGAFTTHQIDLFNFCVSLYGMLLENAIMLKKKLKFERNVKKAFGRFVPESIIDELVRGAERSEKVGVGEKRNVAIMFCDIRSFTNISELNKPETIVAFLNRYFTTMCTIIKKHGGTVDKFIGDAIMAAFGMPVSFEDNCARAVAAAYEMREALADIDLEDLVMPQGMKFSFGIGIHYGEVIMGTFGSSDKTDYSVIGDNVNLASRMEGLTKTYGSMILVSGAVKEDIIRNVNNNDKFIFRYLDDVKVKGKENIVQIYAIDRSKDEFSAAYRDYYTKGFEQYKIGAWELAVDYFQKALDEVPEDKASRLMLDRSLEFRDNPPENWDGAVTFHTK